MQMSMKTNNTELFPTFGIAENERLYIIGNGFDLHHSIDSSYAHFKKWVMRNMHSDLVGMMDVFFSNEREFWGDIENALGEYDEESITDYCKPTENDEFKYDHPTQWQAGIEDSIPYIFGRIMEDFKDAFNDWVKSVDICGIETDLHLPQASKYLTFNYTDTLESAYGIPAQNILHLHGNRLVPKDEFIIGHGNHRNPNDPFSDDDLLLPYQNAFKEVIETMNKWRKNPTQIIAAHKSFFHSLNSCKGVCVIGLSYNPIDMPYLEQVAASVAPDCLWVLNYYSNTDHSKAEYAAKKLGLNNYNVTRFE